MKTKALQQGFRHPESARIQRHIEGRHADLFRGLDANRKSTEASRKLASQRIKANVNQHYKDDLEFV